MVWRTFGLVRMHEGGHAGCGSLAPPCSRTITRTQGVHVDEAVIVVCDDHTAFAESLARFLRSQSWVGAVHVATQGRDALRLVRAGADLLVLDLALDEARDGLEVIEAVRHVSSAVKVLMVSRCSDARIVASALRMGADGFCSKDSDPDDLLLAMQQVLSGQAAIPASMLALVLRSLAEQQRGQAESAGWLALLSTRERAVLELITDGLDRREIAARLGIAPNTVRTHIGHLLVKLGVHSQLEAATLGRRLLAAESADALQH